jgi:hypothetical protein
MSNPAETGKHTTHLEMPPTLLPFPFRNKGIRNPLKLAHRHLGQVIEIDNRPAPRPRAADDVAARRLVVARPVQAVAEVDGIAITAVVVLVVVVVVVAITKRTQDLASRSRARVGQAGD